MEVEKGNFTRFRIPRILIVRDAGPRAPQVYSYSSSIYHATVALCAKLAGLRNPPLIPQV